MPLVKKNVKTFCPFKKNFALRPRISEIKRENKRIREFLESQIKISGFFEKKVLTRVRGCGKILSVTEKKNLKSEAGNVNLHGKKRDRSARLVYT